MSVAIVFQAIVSVFVPAIVTIALALAFYYVRVVRPKRKHLDKIPAMYPNLPLIGAAPYVKRGPALRLEYQKYCEEHRKDGISVHWLGFHPMVAIWRADYVETLLNSHEIKKSFFYDFFKPWLGEGLVTAHGNHWYHHRKLLTPSFHFRILNDYVPIMNEHAEHLVQTLEKHADTKNEVDIFPLVTMATLDVICEAAMGQTTGEEDRKARVQIFNTVVELSHAVQRRQTKPYLWPDFIFSWTPTGKVTKKCLGIMHAYCDKILHDRLETFDRAAVEALIKTDGGAGRRPLPFLDSLLYASENFTKLSVKDIKDEVNTFLFTGHDTTAASTAWTLYCLARHPEAQQKVHEELDTIFGSSNRPVTVEDIKEMRYLTACFRETLRIHPVAPIFAREITKGLKFGDYTVPAGTTVLVLTEILHRDPIYFEEPLKYKPERFLVTSAQKNEDDDDVPNPKIHPFAYVPFSAGQRNCLGQKYAQMEDKILLASILRRFRLECDHPEEDLAPAIELVLRPTKGMFLRLYYR